MKRFTKDSQSWVHSRMKDKKGVELKWNEIPKDRISDFQNAKSKEISNWLKQSAVRLANKHVPKERTLRMRWVFNIKHDGSAKARLVIVGFEDPDLTNLRRSSPVMTRRTRGLFLTMCSFKNWSALKGDVRAAFLQGEASEMDREIFAHPVKELSEALGGDESSYVQILKACYGLVNAPSQWHASVSKTMTAAGFEVLQTDACAWRLVDRSGTRPVTIGLACAHVDDFLFAGESSHPLFQKAIQFVHAAYSWSPWEIDCYMHCGVQVIQHQNGSTVLDHSEYCSQIQPIKFDNSKSDKDKVSPEEHQQLRAVLGAAQWRVYQSAPIHGARLSMLQSQLSSPTIQTLKDTNKLVREMYAHRHVGLRYEALEHEDPLGTVFVAWTDAAVGNRRGFASSGGYFVGACDPRILDGSPSKVCPVSWKSGRLPRVARSSLSAEIQAFSIAEEELMLVRMEWIEMCGETVPIHDPISVLPMVRGALVTDARSLFDVIQKGPGMAGCLKEKYSILDMMSVFQRLERGRTITRWVHSDAQIADSLTKPVANSSLMQVLSKGVWTLVDDPLFTSSKKRKALAKQESSSKEFGVCQFLSCESRIDSNSCFACSCLAQPSLPLHWLGS